MDRDIEQIMRALFSAYRLIKRFSKNKTKKDKADNVIPLTGALSSAPGPRRRYFEQRINER